MIKSTSNTAFRRLSRITQDSPFFASLRTRLVILVLFAILPALGLLIYNALKEANNATHRAVRSAASRQDDLIESTRQLLATLAHLTEVQNQTPEPCRQIFTNLLTLHDVYSDVGASDLNGRIFANATPGVHPTSVANHDFFKKAVSTREFASGNYRITTNSRQAVVTFSFPVLTPKNKLNGIVYATLKLDWLKGLLNNFNLPPNSSMTVMGPRRITLLRYPNDQFVGEPVPTSNPDSSPNPNPRNTATNPPPRPPESASTPPQQFGRTSILRSRDGTWRLYGFSRLGFSDNAPAAMITIGIPLIEMLGHDILFLGIVSALALGAAWFGGQAMIIRRIKDLLAAAAHLSTGNLQARTTIPYDRGELGQLARAFDEMAESIESHDDDRERARQELKQLNEDLERRVTARTLELKRSNEDLEQFASVASHDLQEPLRMVTNYLQLLQHRYAGKLDAKANDFIGFATDGSSRMQQLIKDLLSYSRVTTKQRPFEPTSCQEVLDQALSNLRLAIEESGADITHDSPLPIVQGDPALLAQLFQNLLSNALKFRTEAPPKIHIGATRQGNFWQLSVRDNGIGMAEQDFERIFIIFQRLHGRESYPGTGIGLSLCKKIVERHGGLIRVESQPGQGTCFFFTLPDPSADPKPARPE